MREGMDFENTPLVVESLSKEMQNPPRVLQEKKPGGGEASQNSSCRAHTLCLLIRLLALSAYLTAPSLQAAATRGPWPGLSESNSQIARDIYLQGEHSCQVEPTSQEIPA